jgi:hypothetical protein
LAFVLAALCWLSPAGAEEGEPSAPAHTLSGRVSDAAGQGIAAVEVWISPEGRMTLSDTEGRYRLAGLRAGRYTLAFRRLGYESASRDVEVDGDKTLDVPLNISPFTLEPIVVTSTPASIPPSDHHKPSANWVAKICAATRPCRWRTRSKRCPACTTSRPANRWASP